MSQDPAYIVARLRLGMDDEAADLIEYLVMDGEDIRRKFTTYVLEDPNAPWARNWRITCKRLGWPSLTRHPDEPPTEA